MTTTLIRQAGWAIAWDGGEKRHVYRKGIDIAFGPGGITHVGPGFQGAADVTIDGRGLMVMPRLVNVPSHLGHAPARGGSAAPPAGSSPSRLCTGGASTSAARRSTCPIRRCGVPRLKSRS